MRVALREKTVSFCLQANVNVPTILRLIVSSILLRKKFTKTGYTQRISKR